MTTIKICSYLQMSITATVIFSLIAGCYVAKVYFFLHFFFCEGWLVGWLFWASRPFETVFQSISGRLPERQRRVGWLVVLGLTAL